jgi:hypothetical protein
VERSLRLLSAIRDFSIEKSYGCLLVVALNLDRCLRYRLWDDSYPCVFTQCAGISSEAIISDLVAANIRDFDDMPQSSEVLQHLIKCNAADARALVKYSFLCRNSKLSVAAAVKDKQLQINVYSTSTQRESSFAYEGASMNMVKPSYRLICYHIPSSKLLCYREIPRDFTNQQSYQVPLDACYDVSDIQCCLIADTIGLDSYSNKTVPVAQPAVINMDDKRLKKPKQAPKLKRNDQQQSSSKKKAKPQSDDAPSVMIQKQMSDYGCFSATDSLRTSKDREPEEPSMNHLITPIVAQPSAQPLQGTPTPRSKFFASLISPPRSANIAQSKSSFVSPSFETLRRKSMQLKNAPAVNIASSAINDNAHRIPFYSDHNQAIFNPHAMARSSIRDNAVDGVDNPFDRYRYRDGNMSASSPLNATIQNQLTKNINQFHDDDDFFDRGFEETTPYDDTLFYNQSPRPEPRQPFPAQLSHSSKNIASSESSQLHDASAPVVSPAYGENYWPNSYIYEANVPSMLSNSDISDARGSLAANSAKITATPMKKHGTQQFNQAQFAELFL